MLLDLFSVSQNISGRLRIWLTGQLGERRNEFDTAKSGLEQMVANAKLHGQGQKLAGQFGKGGSVRLSIYVTVTFHLCSS
jgi:hypothetical protein